MVMPYFFGLGLQHGAHPLRRAIPRVCIAAVNLKDFGLGTVSNMMAAHLILTALETRFFVEVYRLAARVIFDAFAITFHVLIHIFALLPELGGISIRRGVLVAVLVLHHDDLVTAYQQRALG